MAASSMRQIIALGSGGFSHGDDSLDRYILDQARSSRPRVAFVGTASGDADSYLAKFYAAFSQLECRPSHLPLFRRTPALAAFVREQDVIYVGGGNTRSMLAVWNDWELGPLLRGAWDEGVVLTGVSAGAICWFEEGVTDSSAGSLGRLPCLGLLPGSCCPHYDGESERRPTYQRLVAEGSIAAGVAIDDAVAVHFVDRAPHRVIASAKLGSAYRVQREAGSAVETSLGVERIELAE